LIAQDIMTPESTVFIVDDDDAVRESLKLLLESHGLTVEDYGSPQAFSQAYRPRERACLVLDYHLPGQTGLDFLESAAGTQLGIPVILVTGGGDRALKARATADGVANYFEKPLDTVRLLHTICHLTRQPTTKDRP
jgi:FixJ family two-component response regulator